MFSQVYDVTDHSGIRCTASAGAGAGAGAGAWDSPDFRRRARSDRRGVIIDDVGAEIALSPSSAAAACGRCAPAAGARAPAPTPGVLEALSIVFSLGIGMLLDIVEAGFDFGDAGHLILG